MNWMILILIVLCLITAGSAVLKMILHKKLKAIDGMGGIHIEDRTKITGIVVGDFGDKR